jgi:hypothetical protein
MLSWTVAQADPTAGDTNAAPAPADNVVRNPGVYSFQAPTGWRVRMGNTGSATVCDMIGANDCVAMITAWVTPREGSLEDFAQGQMDMEKKMHSKSDVQWGDLHPFTTDSGWQGLMYTETITTNGSVNKQTHYFFLGHDDTKVIFGTSCHGESADHYTPIFDAAAKSLTQE